MTLAAFTATEWVIVIGAATTFVVTVAGAIAASAVKIIQALRSHGETMRENTEQVKQNTDALNQQTKP
jgi:hypothetical protein